MYIYCLFCETGKSRYVVRAAEDLLGCCALSPRQIQHTWSGGKMTDRVRDLLPGYVFLYADEKIPEPGRLNRMPDVIRCMRDSSDRYELQGRDEQFALMLLRKDGVVGKTPVWQEGDRIRICEGAFAGLETSILKVDRRASRMLVEIPFARQPVRTWLEYEIVEKMEQEESSELTIQKDDSSYGSE